MPRTLSIALVILAMGLVSSPTLAAGDAQKAEADFWAGTSLFLRKEYDAAAQNFARAYKENALEKYLWNLALSEFRAGQYWNAYKHFEQYKPDPNATAENLGHIDELLASADRHLGHLTVDGPSGFTITIDREAVGVLQLSGPVAIDPDHDHDVNADRGPEHLTIHVAATGAAPSSIRFDAPAPVPSVEGPAAPSALVVSTPAEGVGSRPSTATRNIATLAVLGVAAVSTGLGAGYFLATRNDRDVATAIYPRLDSDASTTGTPRDSICSTRPTLADCASLAAITQQWHDNVAAQNAFYVAAGGLAVVGAVVFFVWPTHPPGAVTWIQPRVDRDGAAVRFGGTF